MQVSGFKYMYITCMWYLHKYKNIYLITLKLNLFIKVQKEYAMLKATNASCILILEQKNTK